MAIIQSLFRRTDSAQGNNKSAPIKSNPLRPLSPYGVLPADSMALPIRGWAPLSLPPPTIAPIESASRSLFRASEVFFSLPYETKEELRTQLGSEEGWSYIPGEKELLALRSYEQTPAELKDVASAFWAEVGKLLNEILRRIAESLGMKPDALEAFVGPCAALGIERTATMLRLFKYEGSRVNKVKVVSEPHSDLGLLSLVVGLTPGLEVWDGSSKRWLALEQTYTAPSATILVGRQLELLSNGRYKSGKHRVVSYPHQTTSSTPASNFRYSMVFVLRAHWPVTIDTDTLETPITGPFDKPMKGITGKELYMEIEKAHFNVNTTVQEREEQKRRLKAKGAEKSQTTQVRKTGFLREMIGKIRRSRK